MKNVFLIITALFFSNSYSQNSYIDWVYGIKGTGKTESSAIALDSENNLIVSGSFFGSSDFDPSNSENILTAQSNNKENVFLSKYNSKGEFIWAIKGDCSERAYALNIALDNNNNIYMVGSFDGELSFNSSSGIMSINNANAGAGNDIFIVKFDTNGNSLWLKHLEGTEDAYARQITISNNFLYIVGDFGGIVDFDPSVNEHKIADSYFSDIFLGKYSLDGELVWVGATSGTKQGGNRGNDVHIDSNGDIFITGYIHDKVDFDFSSNVYEITASTTFARNGFIVKYNSNGEILWGKLIGGIGRVTGMSIDTHEGNIFLTGMYDEYLTFSSNNQLLSKGGNDTFICKLNSLGDLIWVKSISGVDYILPSQIIVDNEGNINVAGVFRGEAQFDISNTTSKLTSVGDYDGFLAKYSSNGSLLWSNKYGGLYFDGFYGWGTGENVVVSKNGTIYCTGQYTGEAYFNSDEKGFILNSQGNDFFIMKMRYAATLNDKTYEIDRNFDKIFPNPTKEALTIISNKLSNKDYIIKDISGRDVKKGVIHSTKQIIDVSNLAGGTYFILVDEQKLKFIIEH